MNPINQNANQYLTLPAFFYVNTGSIHTELNSLELSDVLNTLCMPNVIAQTKLYTDRFFLIKEAGVLCPGVTINISRTESAVMGKPTMVLIIVGMEECTDRIHRIQKIINLTESSSYGF